MNRKLIWGKSIKIFEYSIIYLADYHFEILWYDINICEKIAFCYSPWWISSLEKHFFFYSESFSNPTKGLEANTRSHSIFILQVIYDFCFFKNNMYIFEYVGCRCTNYNPLFVLAKAFLRTQLFLNVVKNVYQYVIAS